MCQALKYRLSHLEANTTQTWIIGHTVARSKMHKKGSNPVPSSSIHSVTKNNPTWERHRPAAMVAGWMMEPIWQEKHIALCSSLFPQYHFVTKEKYKLDPEKQFHFLTFPLFHTKGNRWSKMKCYQGEARRSWLEMKRMAAKEFSF